MDTMIAGRENLAEKLKRWCLDTWDAFNEAKFMAGLDDDTVKLLAQDCALSPEQLRDLVRKGPHAADELIALVRLLGIDATEARLAAPDEFREMHLTCAHCSEKSRCRRELASDVAKTEFVQYCGNADLLIDMNTRPELAAR